MIGRQTGLEDPFRVAQAAIGHNAGATAGLEAPAIDIAGRGRTWVTAGVDHQHVTRRALLHRPLLHRAAPRRSLVLACRNEAHRERRADHFAAHPGGSARRPAETCFADRAATEYRSRPMCRRTARRRVSPGIIRPYASPLSAAVSCPAHG